MNRRRFLATVAAVAAATAIIGGTWLLAFEAALVSHNGTAAWLAYIAGCAVSIVALVVFGAATTPRPATTRPAPVSRRPAPLMPTEILPPVNDFTAVIPFNDATVLIPRYADATVLIPRQRVPYPNGDQR